jgi:D-alanyl-D-alanine dipeptidase
MLLRESVVNKLLEAQKELKIYKFKIWDGYRPRSVQNNIYHKFWGELKTDHPDWEDKRLEAEVGTYVTSPTNPDRIPPHATGGAVDLTLADSSGSNIDMGTEFDYFGPEAESFYFEKHPTNEAIRKNRALLRTLMINYGFRSEPEEWWHFDYGNQLWATAINEPFAIYGEITEYYD